MFISNVLIDLLICQAQFGIVQPGTGNSASKLRNSRSEPKYQDTEYFGILYQCFFILYQYLNNLYVRVHSATFHVHLEFFTVHVHTSSTFHVNSLPFHVHLRHVSEYIFPGLIFMLPHFLFSYLFLKNHIPVHCTVYVTVYSVQLLYTIYSVQCTD